MEGLNIEKKYKRAFDLIYLPSQTTKENFIQLENLREVTLIELKTTQKKLINMPQGFFFGATESEFQLAKQLGENYKFCFVSLHSESRGFLLLSLEELDKIIRTKRIQYQINL